MNTVLAIILHLNGGTDQQTFFDFKSVAACHQIAGELASQPWQIIQRDTRKKAIGGLMTYACITPEQSMELQDATEQD